MKIEYAHIFLFCFISILFVSCKKRIKNSSIQTKTEKLNGIIVDKAFTIYERFLSDSRFMFNQGKENLVSISANVYNFINQCKLNEINPVNKVFAGKILSKHIRISY